MKGSELGEVLVVTRNDWKPAKTAPYDKLLLVIDGWAGLHFAVRYDGDERDPGYWSADDDDVRGDIICWTELDNPNEVLKQFEKRGEA